MRRRWNGLTSHPTLFDPQPDITRRRHRANAASEDANRSVEPRKSELRLKILAHLKRTEGRTCKEVSVDLSIGYTTVSARLSELKREALVVVTGDRREGAAVVRCKE
jgi:predicted transcriptional regulator